MRSWSVLMRCNPLYLVRHGNLRRLGGAKIRFSLFVIHGAGDLFSASTRRRVGSCESPVNSEGVRRIFEPCYQYLWPLGVIICAN